MSSVGLPIDSGSESCLSDLSDSDGMLAGRDLLVSSSPLMGSERSCEFPSRRTRTRRRLEKFRSAAEEDLESAETSGFRRPSHSIRILFSLCLLSLVCLSPRDSSSRPHGSHFRREEITFPLHKQGQKRLKKELPKFVFPKLESHQTRKDSKSGDDMQIPRLRSSLALARSHHESRPVFGQRSQEAPERKLEQFVMEESKPFYPQRHHVSWTSWIAGVALVGIFLETGYKEYRRCRLNATFEEERRL